MQLLCPDCQTAFAGASHCPKCGGRLISPQEAHLLRKKRKTPPPRAVEPTAAGRVTVGVLVALGGYLGLREWVSGGLAGAAVGADEWWGTAAGAWASLGLKAVAAAAGGLVAGAGRADGWMTGGLTGCVAGALLLAADLAAHPAGVGPVAYLAAGAAALAGLFAGTAGAAVWPGPVELPKPLAGSRGSSLLRLAQELEESRKGRPTQWLRIFIGATVAFSGILAADIIRSALTTGSSGALRLGSAFYAPIVCLELAGAVVFFAGAAAGASTGAGLRHGILAGLFAAGAVVALTVVNGQNLFPAVEGFFWVVGIPTEHVRYPSALAELLVAVWVVCALGGWFGGQLLPPLASPDQLRRLGSRDNMLVQID